MKTLRRPRTQSQIESRPTIIWTLTISSWN